MVYFSTFPSRQLLCYGGRLHLVRGLDHSVNDLDGNVFARLVNYGLVDVQGVYGLDSV